jgi:hypothetical protein
MNRNNGSPLPLLCAQVLLCLALGAVFTVAAALPGTGQDKKQPLLKTVHGMVVDKSEDPLPGAIVFLKNVSNKTVKSSFADDDGKYRFSGLDPNTDYEIHAEFKGDVSPTRRLSALDDRKDIYLNLVIPRKK